MSVTPVDGAAGAAQTSLVASAAPKDALGQDAFLKLLITQLTNQDPTNPMDNSEFISQLATFSSLEKLTSIDDSLKKLTNLVTE